MLLRRGTIAWAEAIIACGVLGVAALDVDLLGILVGVARVALEAHEEGLGLVLGANLASFGQLCNVEGQEDSPVGGSKALVLRDDSLGKKM